MHTFLARANAIFAFAFSTLAVLTFLCFCTTVFDDRQPIVSLSVNEHHVEPVRQHARSKYKVDLAVLTFKLYAGACPRASDVAGAFRASLPCFAGLADLCPDGRD